jgi:hypothetical protein
MTKRELPLADSSREKMAIEAFSLNISPDEYAAREGHRWECFSFDEYRYTDGALTEWIQRLGDIFFRRNGAPSVEELRARLLTPQEAKAIEDEIGSRSDDDI